MQAVSEKLDRFQAEIDSVPSEQADRYESLLRRMRYSLHDNHYLITDTKRRLIGQIHRPTCIDLRPNMPCSLARLVSGRNTVGGGSLWYRADCGTVQTVLLGLSILMYRHGTASCPADL